MVLFTQAQVEAISATLGDSNRGLTGTEIELLLRTARMEDVSPDLAKRHRLHNAFCHSQNTKGNRTHILEFIRQSMKPERFLRTPERFEEMRHNLNLALLFAGLNVADDGTLTRAAPVTTLGEARRRADELREDMIGRGAHPDVLAFCRDELLADNYFHAVLEAVKSVLEKIRQRTGLTDDGNTLVERALSGDSPMLAINVLASENDRSEQKGFANLVRGVIGMFRNTTAHAPRSTWPLAKEDAEDLLTIVSLIHRRLDTAQTPPGA